MSHNDISSAVGEQHVNLFKVQASLPGPYLQAGSPLYQSITCHAGIFNIQATASTLQANTNLSLPPFASVHLASLV